MLAVSEPNVIVVSEPNVFVVLEPNDSGVGA